MKMRNVRNKLLKAIVKLEERYDKEYTSTRIEYAQTGLIDVLLNYLKTLEYHYRDDVRAKKNPEYNAAMKLFREIGEPVDPNWEYTDYRLKEDYGKSKKK